MDVIDEKGRLFGTINIIDALVIVLIVAVLASGIALVAGSDSTPDQQTDATTNTTNTTVTIEIESTQQHVADAIPGGTTEINETIVTVENKRIEPRTVVVKTEDDELVEREHPTQKTLTLEVTLETTDEDVGVSYLGTPVRVGEELTVDFGTGRVTGTVTDVDDRNE